MPVLSRGDGLFLTVYTLKEKRNLFIFPQKIIIIRKLFCTTERKCRKKVNELKISTI